MDSLKVHICNNVMDMYKELDIDIILAPIYSPEYNPIEMMFSKMKRIVKRLRLQDMVKEKKRPFNELIPIAAKEIEI